MRTRTPLPSLVVATSLLLGAAGLGLVGCSKQPTTTPDEPAQAPADAGGAGNATDAADASGEPAASEPTWAEMDRGQRLEYMGTVVMPEMKEAFKTSMGFDTLKCANCHGEDYKEVDFAMPNDLTPLNPDDPIQSGMDLDEDMTKFMVSTVLPRMAEMVGKETDVTTGKGEFGCLDCHLSE